MERWMGRVVEAEARIGGRYRIEHATGNGQVYIHKGEYRVLEQGRRIVQTFSAGPADREPAGATPQDDELVEVTFRPLDEGGTQVTLTNSWSGQALDADDMTAVERAWAHWLELLDRQIGE
jgi:uncharacterized protein YndB with AHSA1/START domain